MKLWFLTVAIGATALSGCLTKTTDQPLDTGGDTGAGGASDSALDSSGAGGDDDTPVDTSQSNPDSASDSAVDSEDSGDSPPPPSSLFPVAPDAAHPMWQGVQEAFVTGDGVACTGSVAVGVGESAVCYAAADGALRCAGALYGRGAALGFVDAGLRDITQVFLSAADSASGGSSVCALAGGRVSCLGAANDYGQFGNGGLTDSSSFVAGSASGLTHLATGAWDQMCGPDGEGTIQCAGYSFGASYESAGEGSAVWVATDGRVHLDDSTVWRASPDHTFARLGSRGLDCDSITCRYGGMDGATGLVDVVVKQRFPDGVESTYPDEVCTLSTAGAVTCTHLDQSSGLPLSESHFVGKHVLLLAASYAASSLCAVVDDGSMWCQGANESGQLGTGDATYVSTEAQVVPAGEVRISCR